MIEFEAALSLVAGGIGAALGSATVLASERARSHARREHQLRAANDFLRRHLKALAALDDDDTPVRCLDLAIRFSQLIQNPHTPKVIALALKENPSAFKVDNIGSKTNEWDQEIRNLAARPDLASAFATMLVSGMAAFVSRWPECKLAFDDLLVDIVAAPVREASAIVTVTSRAFEYQAMRHQGFAAA